MTIKRMLLLLSAMAAFVAFAAPAAQAESWWTTDPGDILLGSQEEKTTVTATGDLSTSRPGIINGPAVVHAHGFLWNENGHGEGTIDGFQITPFATSLPGCSATATNNTEVGESWKVTLTTNQLVHIGAPWNSSTGGAGDDTFITFTNHYSQFCQETYKLPATLSATGEVTGTYDNSGTNAGCITFAGDTGLKIEGSSGTVPIELNGKVCLHEAGGGSFTAKST